LNSILDETISKLELRKTNLFALKDSKSINIEDLNKQIAELKAKVKDLESEVKSLETEDEQIITNITALQSMKLGEAVNNKDYKKTTKKVA
jgi:cell division protein FtsB